MEFVCTERKKHYFLFKRISGTTNFFCMNVNYVEAVSVNQKSKFTLVVKLLVIKMSILTLHL